MLLERLLGGLDVSVRPFAVRQIAQGIGLELADDGSCEVHYVLAGSGVVVGPTREPIRFEQGAVLVLPRRPGVRIQPDSASELVHVCGVLQATIERRLPLFGHLQGPLAVACTEDEDVRRAFEVVVREQASSAPGGQALVGFAMTTVVVLVLRHLVREGDGRIGWLRALSDPRLGAALDAIVDDPGAPHGVGSLAQVAGMSRSAFALAFQEAFGVAPMEMVRATRIRRAAGLLRTTSLSVAQIAARVGYASRSQFSRTFKAEIGVDPSTYRRQRSPPAPGSTPGST